MHDAKLAQGAGSETTQTDVPSLEVEQKQLAPPPHPAPEPSSGHTNGSSHDWTHALSSQRCRLGQQRPAQNSRRFLRQRFRFDDFLVAQAA